MLLEKRTWQGTDFKVELDEPGNLTIAKSNQFNTERITLSPEQIDELHELLVLLSHASGKIKK